MLLVTVNELRGEVSFSKGHTGFICRALCREVKDWDKISYTSFLLRVENVLLAAVSALFNVSVYSCWISCRCSVRVLLSVHMFIRLQTCTSSVVTWFFGHLMKSTLLCCPISLYFATAAREVNAVWPSLFWLLYSHFGPFNKFQLAGTLQEYTGVPVSLQAVEGYLCAGRVLV